MIHKKIADSECFSGKERGSGSVEGVELVREMWFPSSRPQMSNSASELSCELTHETSSKRCKGVLARIQVIYRNWDHKISV